MKKETKEIMIFLIAFLVLMIAGILFFRSQGEEIDLKNGENKEQESEVFVFHCPSEDTIEITYYKNNDSAKIIFKNEEYLLNRAVSGSGTRYTNEDESVVFWEHQEEAILEVNGETVAEKCQLPGKETNEEQSNVEDSITEYLLTKQDFSWKTKNESQNFCVVENLHPENYFFPYYAWVRCGEFILNNDSELEELSGSSLPAKIEYPEKSSTYELDKFSHEIPRDGSYYDEDVIEIFPENVRNEMLKYRQEDFILTQEKLEFEALKWFSSSEFSDDINLWENVKKYINNCEVKEVSQTHNKVVTVTLNNNKTIKAVQPEIDDIFEILQDPELKEKCGEDIIMSTE
jgi:membrane-bound inhibitor of C-type lysozyme